MVQIQGLNSEWCTGANGLVNYVVGLKSAPKNEKMCLFEMETLRFKSIRREDVKNRSLSENWTLALKRFSASSAVSAWSTATCLHIGKVTEMVTQMVMCENSAASLDFSQWSLCRRTEVCWNRRCALQSQQWWKCLELPIRTHRCDQKVKSKSFRWKRSDHQERSSAPDRRILPFGTTWRKLGCPGGFDEFGETLNFWVKIWR